MTSSIDWAWIARRHAARQADHRRQAHPDAPAAAQAPMQMPAGVPKPTAGCAWVDLRDIQLSSWRAATALVTQQGTHAFFFNLSFDQLY
jgi:hypothetical protein